LLIVAGVVALLIAFTCAVGALVRREEQRGMSSQAQTVGPVAGARCAGDRGPEVEAAMSDAARDEARAEAKRVRAERRRRRQPRAKPAGMPPAPAEDPVLILHMRDHTDPR
jgi:hypothetical protein